MRVKIRKSPFVLRNSGRPCEKARASSEIRTFLTKLREVNDGFEPPNLGRNARDLSQVVSDLELMIVVGAAIGDDSRALAALALLEQTFASLPRAGAGCPDQLSDIAYLSMATRDALLTMLARRGAQSTEADTHLLAAALRTRERDVAAQALATGAALGTLRRELDIISRQVEIARDALDVELTRSLQLRQVAAQEAFWNAQGSTPVSSVEEIADRIRVAQVQLAEGEALFATLPVDRFAATEEFVSILVTKAGIRVASRPAPEGWRMLRDGLDIGGVRDAAGSLSSTSSWPPSYTKPH